MAESQSGNSRESHDEYEQRYMRDGSPVLHRDKRVERKTSAALAVTGLSTLVGAMVVAALQYGSMNPTKLAFLVATMVGLGALFTFLGLTYGVVRTIVTAEHVRIQYGTSGPTIALNSITSCKVVDYDLSIYGSWGVTIGTDGSRAYVPSGKEVVEICYREQGDDKKVVVGVADAKAMVSQINKARDSSAVRVAAVGVEEARDSSSVRVVGVGVEAEREADAAAEAEALAEAEAEASARRS